MTIFRPLYIVAIGLLCLCLGCNPRGAGSGAEGVIVYDLTYPEFAKDNIFSSMFPSSSQFTFKGTNTRTELKTTMAVFSTILLADQSTKRMVHLVRIGKDYSGLELDSSQVMAEYGKLPDGMHIDLTDKTKEIAGYHCHHAMVRFDKDTTRVIDLYYTEDINIPEPNWCTPYHKVKGVLMEAQVNKFGIEMKMVAREVRLEQVEDEVFQFDPNYKPISAAEMADIFQSF